MKFVRYRSLENHYRGKTVQRVKSELDPAGTLRWIATEKIHGANFSFWYDGAEIQIASRSDFVDETFYGAGEAISACYPAVRELHAVLNRPFAVFGELCGPGIQKGVHYGDEKQFIAFDIYYPGAHYENPERAEQMLTAAGFSTAPIVATGTLDALLELDIETLPSRVAGYDESNHAEGIVIKPEMDLYTSDGSRVVFKKKAAAFAERRRGPRKAKPVVELTDEENAVLADLQSYVNRNRVDSAISKLGEFHPSQIGRLIGMIVQDVLTDYNADHDTDVKEMYKYHWKQIQRGVVDLVRAHLLEVDREAA